MATPKPTPKATPKPSPLAGPVKAMNNLMLERQAFAKKYGFYPSDEELMKSRKKMGSR